MSQMFKYKLNDDTDLLGQLVPLWWCASWETVRDMIKCGSLNKRWYRQRIHRGATAQIRCPSVNAQRWQFIRKTCIDTYAICISNSKPKQKQKRTLSDIVSIVIQEKLCVCACVCVFENIYRNVQICESVFTIMKGYSSLLLGRCCK